ncbi:MAG: ASPIC/UnbV domain-containing protein, partial [Planctomycetota bacterium]
GRGLAQLDWNGDGRPEVVATHLNGPSVLLENESISGATVSLRLVGTRSDRDAVGTRVRVSTKETDGSTALVQTKWITAGDGYLCGDEKRLCFGLADAPAGAPLSVSVRWPSGAVEPFAGVVADGRFLLIEGRATADRLPN